MSLLSFGDKSRRELARQFLDDYRDKGEFDLAQPIAAFADHLRSHPELLDPDGTARREMIELDRDLRPKRKPGQVTLFDIEAIIPIGDRKRVSMKFATREHLIHWAAIRSAENAAQQAAYAEDAKYWSSRIAAWQPHHRYLPEVEAEMFGSEEKAAD